MRLRSIPWNLGLALALLGATSCMPRKASQGPGAQMIDTRIGKLAFTHDFANGYPTKETVETLYDEHDFQRACQLYLWSPPAASFAEWQHGQESIGARSGDISASLSYDDRLGIPTPTRRRPTTSSSATSAPGLWSSTCRPTSAAA